MIKCTNRCLIPHFSPTSLLVLLVRSIKKCVVAEVNIQEYPRTDSPCPCPNTVCTASVRHMPNVPSYTAHMPTVYSPCLLSASLPFHPHSLSSALLPVEPFFWTETLRRSGLHQFGPRRRSPSPGSWIRPWKRHGGYGCCWCKWYRSECICSVLLG